MNQISTIVGSALLALTAAAVVHPTERTISPRKTETLQRTTCPPKRRDKRFSRVLTHFTLTF